jgi:hypothetical protein
MKRGSASKKKQSCSISEDRFPHDRKREENSHGFFSSSPLAAQPRLAGGVGSIWDPRRHLQQATAAGHGQILQLPRLTLWLRRRPPYPTKSPTPHAQGCRVCIPSPASTRKPLSRPDILSILARRLFSLLYDHIWDVLLVMRWGARLLGLISVYLLFFSQDSSVYILNSTNSVVVWRIVRSKLG